MCLSALLLVSACGPGKPEDGASGGTSGATSTGLASDSMGTGPAPTEATSTTASSSATSTTEPSEATTTDGSPWSCEAPFVDWGEEHVDCMIDWPTMTAVHGEGPAAGLIPVTRVFFGVVYYNCGGDGLDGLWLWQVVLDDPFMPAGVVRGGASCGPEGWIGEYEGEGTLSGSETPFSVMVTIDGFTGDWMSVDPVDPPRLLGTFARDLVGPFEAVHCAALDRYFGECA